MEQGTEKVGPMELGIAAAVVIGGIALAIWWNSPTTEAAPTDPAAAAEQACRADWHRCADNTTLVNTWDGTREVTTACKLYAKDQARFGEPRFSDTPFPTYVTGKSYIDTGLVLLKDNGAQLQNGFGAMAHVDLQCLYDLNSRKVVDFSVTPH